MEFFAVQTPRPTHSRMASQLFRDQGCSGPRLRSQQFQRPPLWQQLLIICVHSCPFVVNSWLPLVGGFQPTDVMRVTTAETYFASFRGNFRTSTVTFCVGKIFSKCFASPSANVSIRLKDSLRTNCLVSSATAE